MAENGGEGTWAAAAAAAAAVAKNRDRWWALTSGPIPHPGARN